MTKQHCNKLLDYYKQHTEIALQMTYRMDTYFYLLKHSLHLGICHCSKRIFDTGLVRDGDLVKFIPEGKSYICDPPSYGVHNESIKKSLIVRIEVLETILKSKS